MDAHIITDHCTDHFRMISTLDQIKNRGRRRGEQEMEPE